MKIFRESRSSELQSSGLDIAETVASGVQLYRHATWPLLIICPRKRFWKLLPNVDASGAMKSGISTNDFLPSRYTWKMYTVVIRRMALMSIDCSPPETVLVLFSPFDSQSNASRCIRIQGPLLIQALI